MSDDQIDASEQVEVAISEPDAEDIQSRIYVANYIVEMVSGLITLAQTPRFKMLTYLLEVAQLQGKKDLESLTKKLASRTGTVG